MPAVVEEAAQLMGRSDVRLASLMDHTPGQRQFRDEESCGTTIAAKKAA